MGDYTREDGKQTKEVETGMKSILMVMFMKVLLNMERLTEKVNFFGRMATHMKANG